ncbi:CapA family protein [Microbulbifer yueqingensis]|uniref:Poly-gamma-glutamate synthesis protein (Capsule biosynthesis protein) n=1 Tax=Microbulbifer yueqingensis TaxID=658219 RepID=A0A1G9CH09_9GAMM|nr:CapA family protein [Microbulbifer yueqingensis]SDK50962.1 poly-gamma-glutamate synthesis protein (capsule biosynthesis protein) [Microbulbifer yueqingensis]
MRLILAGDVMTGRGIDQILPNAGSSRIYESWLKSAYDYVVLAERRNGPIPLPVSPGYIWGDALEVMQARLPDFRVINLETAVTTSNDCWPGKGIQYRMHPANLDCLTVAEIDICSLANNHVLDWGYPGLGETLTSLHKTGIRTAGAGLESAEACTAITAHCGNARLVMFACGHGSSGIPPVWGATPGRAGVCRVANLSNETADDIAHRINAARQPGDITMLSIHWGGNWGYAVPTDQQRFARRLVEAGVDIVCGHSSHHSKAIEIYRDRPILYGCGDLINDYEGIGGQEQFRSDLRVLYCVELSKDGGLQSLELIPFQSRRLQLEQAPEKNRRWLRQKLDSECGLFGGHLRSGTADISFFLEW